MSKTVSIADLPELEHLLQDLRDGALVVTDRAGEPVAAVVPYGRDAAERAAFVQAMMRLSEPAFADVWSSPEDDVYDQL